MITLQNKGLLEIEFIKTMGTNVKITDDPIGFFGTGLKYAIAVFLREGVDIKLFIGNNEYTFFTEQKMLRDKTFDYCYMAGPFDKVELNITTEVGKNWDLWQAYREIHSNCLDENGTIAEDYVAPKEGYTTFHIDNDGLFKISDVFLSHRSGGANLLYKNDEVEIYEGASDIIYYKGIRAKDLHRKSQYTYNIIKYCTLTEDRLLCYDFQVKEIISKATVGLANENQDVMKAIVTAPSESFESTLSMNSNTHFAPSDEFVEQVESLKKNNENVLSSVIDYIKAYRPDPLTPEEKRKAALYELESVCSLFDLTLTDYGDYVELAGAVLEISDNEPEDGI